MKKIIATILTLGILALAGWFGYKKYEHYINNPWTRDGQVRSQVIQITPRVTGMVTALYIKDNQFVRKGDLLFEIDPSTSKASTKRTKEPSAKKI